MTRTGRNVCATRVLVFGRKYTLKGLRLKEQPDDQLDDHAHQGGRGCFSETPPVDRRANTKSNANVRSKKPGVDTPGSPKNTRVWRQRFLPGTHRMSLSPSWVPTRASTTSRA